MKQISRIDLWLGAVEAMAARLLTHLGKDERLPVKSFFECQEYPYPLVKTLSGGRVAASPP